MLVSIWNLTVITLSYWNYRNVMAMNLAITALTVSEYT